MTNGGPPNRSSAVRAMFEAACRKPPTFTRPDEWRPEFHDFLSRVLVQDPAQRASTKQLLEHRWLKTGAKRSDMGRFFQRVFMVKTLDSVLGF